MRSIIAPSHRSAFAAPARALAAAAGLLALLAGSARAQDPMGPGKSDLFTASELEEYLRFLQSQGRVPLYPWSVRGFSPQEVDRLAPRGSVHPWAERYPLTPDTSAGLRVGLVRPRVDLVYNSAFPYGTNDGPVWAGRGLTTVVQAGVSARYGPVSLVLAPVAFRTQNADFELSPNGLRGYRVYADDREPQYIDLPQRFGDEAYTRIDPGQSTLRVDARGVALGASTANQYWGPATQNPMVLGNNAPGFPHLFLGTSRPVNLWIGKGHGRIVWGRLEQSDYSPIPPAVLPAGMDPTDFPITAADADKLPVLLGRRFMSGMVATFTPRGLPGLEVGGTRFFHTPWPRSGLSPRNFLKPAESLLKVYLSDTDASSSDQKSDRDNQIASVFFRWVFPRSGFEMYGEFGKEDHNWNRRDAALEPDHHAGYMLGFRKASGLSGNRLLAVRGEVLNTEVSHIYLVRSQSPFYRHALTYQGHTERGQLLGSPAGFGGAGSVLAADYYHERGRATLSWTRTLNKVNGEFLEKGIVDPKAHDVVHTLGAESLLFVGKLDVTAGLNGAYNLNRNFQDDAFNLNLVLRVQARF
ncbi:MAG TPA: capsule assembly Wzi family protein [Longimicrobiaceae bacterium]